MRTTLLLLIVGLMGLPLRASAQERIIKHYSAIQSLEIEGGSLEVSYTGEPNKTELEISAYLGADKDQEKQLVFITMGAVLKVAYKPDRTLSNNYKKPKRFIKITGPENMLLAISNSSGAIEVDNIRSDKTRLMINSGKIRASGIRGDLTLKGSSGNILAKDISGSVDCSITSGMTTIEEVGGNLNFSSTSGGLIASNVKGKVNAKLTSGSVSLENIGELGELAVSSGNVKATRAGLGSSTYLKASSGSFYISTPSDLKAFNFDLQASSGSVSVGESSGGKKLLLQNNASSTVRGIISSGRIRIEN